MAQRKQGRGWGDLKAQTPEGRALAQFLREALDRAGMQIRDLETPTRYSRTSVGQILSGEKTPSREFVDRFVSATTPPREKEVLLRQAMTLLKAAKNPATPTASAAPGSEIASLATVAATAQGQAAQAQEQLRLAHQRNEELTRERDDGQRMVLSLSLLSSDLRQRIATVEQETGDQARSDLKKLTAQLTSAQRELERAKAGRDETELLVLRLRRRSDALEEQLAQARNAGTVNILFSDGPGTDSSPRPEEVQEAAFQTDFARALSAAQGFLDEGQAHRDEVREEWSLVPRPRTVGPLEQWRTATYVATRALGCTLTVAGTLAQATSTYSGIPVLLALMGLLLVADPWEPAAKLWPLLRSLIQQRPPEQTLVFSSRGLALRGGRCLCALLTAAGAVLCTQAAQHWGAWWLVLLFPLTLALGVYTVIGQDDRVTAAVQQVLGDLAADFSTSPPRPGRPKPTQLIALADPDWLADRRQELSTAFAQGWKPAALWVKVLMLTPVALFVIALLGSLGTATLHTFQGTSWDGAGMVALVDEPVRAYLKANSAGLSVTEGTLYTTWLASGIGLLVISFATGTFGARLTWIAWGAGSVFMVWAGTPAPARGIACGAAGLAWGVASIFALQGLGTRRL